MNLRRYTAALCVAGALWVAGASARAQTPEHGEQHETPGTPEGGHGEGGHGEGFHNPGPINWTNIHPEPVRVHHGEEVREVPGAPPFIGPIINFLILATILYMAVKRSINPALAERRAAVETELAEARKMKSDAEAMHKEYTDRLARLDKEIEVLKGEFVKAGEVERDRIVREAEARAERMRADGQAALDQELKNLRDELRREALLAAATAAEETIRKSITAADQTRLADDYLQRLEAQASSGAANQGARA